MIQVQVRIQIDKTVLVETDVFKREDVNENEERVAYEIESLTEAVLSAWANETGMFVNHEKIDGRKTR